MAIRYLKNSDIDMKAWDKCISGSFNRSLCALSWYLDLICEDWAALVENDYQSVMPLNLRHFMGYEVIALPWFAHDLGIYSIQPITPGKTRSFIEALQERFRYFRIVLNKYNPLDFTHCETNLHKRFELDLIEPYYKLTRNYTSDLSKKLNITVAHGFYFSGGLSPNDLIRLILNEKIPVPKAIKNHDFRLLRTLMAGLIRYKSGELYGLFDKHNEISSMVLVAWMNTQINLVFQVTVPSKIAYFPHLFLIDRLIDKYAETNATLLIDPGVTPVLPLQFKDFGARENNYTEVFQIKLPFPLNFFIH